ncbi:MAG: hypothetical protein J6M06_02540, partial [Synergistaceae bacterium]|nr:hypothetical protein [Synergistaceae bacterium]
TVANKCANRVALHHLAYYAVREAHPALGSQMVCNAIKVVADAYKAFFADSPKKRREEWETIVFSDSSVYYDARTYSMKDDVLSLFTLSGRIKVSTHVEDFQARSLARGRIKEAELVRTRNHWYFNLGLDLPDAAPSDDVDIGENNLKA